MIVQSRALLAVPRLRHGFSTRRGGVSAGPFSSLNLDRGVGDEDASVAANRARFTAMLELPPGTELVQVNQVHGVTVLDEAKVPRAPERPEADALVCTRPGVAIGVRTADCVPILVAARAPSGAVEAVAAVHAGWRGAVAGIVREAVRALEALGARRDGMLFAIGPAIGPAAFEVGAEVVEAAQRSLGGAAPPVHTSPKGTPHLDLTRLVELHLAQLDVAPDRVERVGGCTHDQPELYFSHRRDRGRTGRHLSAIAWLDHA